MYGLSLEGRKDLKVESQLEVPIMFHDLLVDKGYRLDLLVEDLIIVELKAVSELSSIYKESSVVDSFKVYEKAKRNTHKFSLLKYFLHEGQQTFITQEYSKLPVE